MEAIVAFILFSGILINIKQIKNKKNNQKIIDKLNNIKNLKKIQRSRQISHKICYDEGALEEWKSLWSDE